MNFYVSILNNIAFKIVGSKIKCVATDILLSSFTCSFIVIILYGYLHFVFVTNLFFIVCCILMLLFVVNKNKFVVTWTRQYCTRRNNLTLTIALRWPWKAGVFLAIFTFFYCNPINNKWKISRTKEKYKTTTNAVLGLCTGRNFYIL